MTIAKLLSEAFEFLNRLFRWFQENAIKEAARNEIENEARQHARQTVNDLRDALDQPVDIDGLPDDFWADEPENDGGGSVGASLRFPTGTQRADEPAPTQLAPRGD